MRARAVTTLALALAACRAEPPGERRAQPAASQAAPQAATTTLAPPPSAAAILSGAAAVEPGGRVPLGPAETVVDPAATFEIEMGARCADARLVLLDAQDALVPATSACELGATTRLTLAPAAPLRPGSRYVLRIDGASTRELHDAEGRPFAPVSHPVLVAGDPPPPEPKRPPRRRRR